MENKKNGKGVASLVLGVVSMLFSVSLPAYGGFIALAPGILAIVFGAKAKKAVPSDLATAGFILGIIGTALSAIVIVVGSILINVFHRI